MGTCHSQTADEVNVVNINGKINRCRQSFYSNENIYLTCYEQITPVKSFHKKSMHIA